MRARLRSRFLPSGQPVPMALWKLAAGGFLLLALGALGGCAGNSPSNTDPSAKSPDISCEPLAAWLAGLAGQGAQDSNKPSDQTCQGTDLRVWREASNLGSELRRMMADLNALTAAGQANPNSAMESARLQREIDQIRGAAQIRGWPVPE